MELHSLHFCARKGGKRKEEKRESGKRTNGRKSLHMRVVDITDSDEETVKGREVDGSR